SSGRTISVNGATQRSNITANDFTKTVIYTVTAADDTSVDYAVTVKLQPYVPVYCLWDISSFDSECLWE
ncbi:MAG TPA: hypothetical protein PL048_24305, partial [Leptospiraceae bacterium]|nr:hypothetical protein [Leptospiraceae bacterium]